MERRAFIKTTGAAIAATHIMSGFGARLFAGTGAAGIGMCDWNLGGACKPELIPKAHEIGLQGIQVSVATDPDNVALRAPAVRRRYLELGKKHQIVFHSVAAGGILNKIPLASEPESAVYVIDAIEAAAALGASNILTAFFGKGDLRYKDENGKPVNLNDNGFSSYRLKEKDVDRVVAVMKQIAPRAEDVGVIIGLENTLTAKQNLEIIDLIGSKMVQVYYDIGNSTGNGYDVPGELRLLGNHRICEVHIKDRKTPVYDGKSGEVDMPACAKALADIEFDKWLVLETRGRKDMFEADTRSNIAFVRQTFTMA